MELQYIDDVLLHPAVLAKCCQAVENYWQHMYITVNCQLGKRSTDRSVSGVVGTRIDRELAFVGVESKYACDQDGESQEWGLACRWHGDVTQLLTPRKIGSSVWIH